MKSLFRWNKSGFDVQNTVFAISFIDDASRQLFRGDLQRARRTLSSLVPLLLIVPSRLRNGRQRDWGGVTPNKAAKIRKPVSPVRYD